MPAVEAQPGHFERLPLELREDIYIHVMADLPPNLHVGVRSRGSVLHPLVRRLSNCLKLNHQILKEAAMAYLRRTTLVVDSTGFGDLETLLDQFPKGIAYRSVRRLEFTRPQECYAWTYQQSRSTRGAASCVHDIVRRCPGLRRLRFTVATNMLFTTHKWTNTVRPRTMEEIEEMMKFSPLWDQTNIRELHLDCPKSFNPGDSTKISRQFEAFRDHFKQEAKRPEGKIDITADSLQESELRLNNGRHPLDWM